MERMNVGGAVAAVRAAARAGVARLVHTSSAATIGEASGDDRHRAHAPPRLVPVDVRADQDRGRARRARHLARGRPGPRARQPVLRPGTRARRRHRPDSCSRSSTAACGCSCRRNVSLVDIDDCVDRPPARGRARRRRRALPGQWNDARDRPGAGAGGRRRRRRAEAAFAAPPGRDRGRGRGRARASSSPAAGRRCAARWSARCSTATATTDRAPSASLGCATPTPARRCARPSSGRGPRV